MDWLLIHMAPVFVIAPLAASAWSLAANREHVARLVRPGGKQAIAILALLLLAWAGRQFLVPHEIYAYFDEMEHMEYASHLLETGEFGFKPGAGDPRIEVDRPSKWPPAHHVLLAGAYWLFGTSPETAFSMNSFLGALAALAAWLLARALGFSSGQSLFAAAAIAAWPLHLKLSGSASLEAGASLAIMFASFMGIVWLRTGSFSSFAGAAAALALAGLYRLEATAAAAVLPVALMASARFRTGTFPEFRLRHAAVLALLLAPVLGYIAAGSGIYGGYRTAVQGKPYLHGLSFWLGGDLMPAGYSAMLGLGFCSLLVGARASRGKDGAPGGSSDEESFPGVLGHWPKAGIVLALASVLVILGMDAVYTYYSHSDIGAHAGQRYQLTISAAVAVLAAAAARGAAALGRRFRPAPWLLALGLVVSAGLCLPNVNVSYRPGLRAEYLFIEEAAQSLPGDADYFAVVPAALSSVMGRRAYPVEALSDPETRGPWSREGGIYFRDVWMTGVIGGHFYVCLDREVRSRCVLDPLIECDHARGKLGFYRLEDCAPPEKGVIGKCMASPPPRRGSGGRERPDPDR